MAEYVNFSIVNEQYTQDSANTRKLNFTVNYSIINASKVPVGTSVLFSIEIAGVVNTSIAETRTLSTSSGSFSFSYSDAPAWDLLSTNPISLLVNMLKSSNLNELIGLSQSKQISLSGGITPNTTWLASSFGSNVKLQDGILSGDAVINRSNTFDSSFNNTPLILFQQIKFNGTVIDLKQYPFVMGSANQITKQLSGNYSQSNITVELYVWTADSIPLSTVQTKQLTNISTTPIETIPVAPVLSIIVSSLPNYKLLKWNKISNATTFNIETFTPSFPSWNSLTGDFTAGSNNDLGDGSWGLNVVMGTIAGDYIFRIRAKNGAGYSNYSQTIEYTIEPEVIPPPPPPPPPVVTIPNPPILQMLVSSLPNYKLLKWNKDSNVVSYNVESSNPLTDPLWQSLTGDFVTGENNDLGDGNWGLNVVMGIQEGLWKYRIRGKNSAGYSNYSNIVSYTIVPPDQTPPPDNTGTTNKNLLSMFTKLFTMGTGLSLLVSKK